jgi:outer membrane receptor for monomeric catechols
MDVTWSRSNDIFVKMQLGCHPVAVVQYTFTHKQYTEQHKTNKTQNNTKIFGRVLAVPRLCDLYPGICLTTEEKARKNLSQGSRRVPAGTMKLHNHTIRIHRHNK